MSAGATTLIRRARLTAIPWAPAGVLLGIMCAGLVVWLPDLAVGALVVLGFLAAFIFRPKATLIGFGCFLFIQDALVAIASSSALATLLQRADDAGLIAMFLVTAARLHPWRVPIGTPLLYLLIVGVASSLTFGIVSFPAFGSDAYFIVKPFLVLLIAAQQDWTRRDIRTVVRIFALLGLLLLLTGILDYVDASWRTLVHLPSLQYRLGLPAAQGILTWPGLFGEVMDFLALFAVGLALGRGDRRNFLLALVFGIGMILSLRLRFLVSVPVALLLGGLLLAGRRRMAALLTVVLFGGVAIALSPLFHDLLAVKSASFGEGARTQLTHASIRIAEQRFPLGTGLGTFGGYASLEYYSPVYNELGLSAVYGLSPSTGDFVSDTQWPYILGETGIAGAALYLLCLGVVFVAVLRVARTSGDGRIRGLAYGTVFVLIDAALEGFVAPIFQESLSAFLVMFGAGIVIALGARDLSMRAKDWHAPPFAHGLSARDHIAKAPRSVRTTLKEARPLLERGPAHVGPSPHPQP